MTISRLLILQVLLAGGLGGIYLIPHESKTEMSRVRMELPETLGPWIGTPGTVSEKEHETLAPDTQFCREVYDDGFGDHVLVSIVLSGNDLDNSIHRPERCLPAQGWTIDDSRSLSLPVSAAPGGMLPVTRLHNYRQVILNDGKVAVVHNLDYYWFIGYTDITASHFEREFIDIKDRLLLGYNQRWAFVTVAATITQGLPGVSNGSTEAQTDDMIQKVIVQVYPQIVTRTGATGTGRD